jgi:hypothetical protein
VHFPIFPLNDFSARLGSLLRTTEGTIQKTRAAMSSTNRDCPLSIPQKDVESAGVVHKPMIQPLNNLIRQTTIGLQLAQPRRGCRRPCLRLRAIDDYPLGITSSDDFQHFSTSVTLRSGWLTCTALVCWSHIR